MNVEFLVGVVVGDDERLARVSSLDLHEAVGRVSQSTRQDLALEHRVDHRALPI